ncbi:MULTISPECIES: shikimate dehydrogenase [Bacillus]|uniref:Shikimate dehydrogenase (NADP(+)) n=2 Tax=Bacillus TaxID=1386 RepID=A0A0M4FQZ7_9BACI|nr:MULTISPECIES: shikimate dehydrogenase [Bacillus]ALC81697.1 shikimate dehydrogenase [Bacillus gobiensis]MBP1080750.1 shikimate dehydrogenase [Bacillus capparidis]MED1094605.1 shikimate dehydrogenase [Bacillus capparidis]
MKHLYGLIGNPVSHSMSPDIHNSAFQDLNLNYYYQAFHVENSDLADAIKGIKSLGIKGFNVTVPHKVSIMEYLDDVDESAKQLGAVNTVLHENGKLIGYNTDGNGFLQSIKPSLSKPLEKNSILVIGAGGAARAIYYTLSKFAPEKIDICNRTLEKAVYLIEHFGAGQRGEALTIQEAESNLSEYDVIIQTTTIGMHPDTAEKPISLKMAKDNSLVCDIIYNPLKTALLKEAEAKGLQTLNGVGMLVEQAALSFHIWTGMKPNTEKMAEIIVGKLGGEHVNR